MIAYWPSPNRWEKNETPPMKKEILYQGVEGLAFEFYIAPAKNSNSNSYDKEKKEAKSSQEKNAIEPEPKGEWRKLLWLEEFKQLPVMVKIKLEMPKGQDSLVFVYPLANAKDHVIYE